MHFRHNFMNQNILCTNILIIRGRLHIECDFPSLIIDVSVTWYSSRTFFGTGIVNLVLSGNQVALDTINVIIAETDF